jgi:hypothetical protein
MPKNQQQGTTPVEFTLSHLWLLQRYVRHEMHSQDTWHNPPVSFHLNEQIAHALLVLQRSKQTEKPPQETYILDLTYHDCLVIDAVIPQDAKDTNGIPIGMQVLFKSYEARDKLDLPESEDPNITFTSEVVKRMLNQDTLWQQDENSLIDGG